MPRKVDLSNFQDLGAQHWKASSGSSSSSPANSSLVASYNPGILAVRPVIEMLIADYPRVIGDQSRQTKTTVIYDKEYPFYYYYKNLVEGMGFVSPSGELDKESLSAFLNELFEYACQIGEKKRETEIIAKATELAIQFPHMTVEQWANNLRGK